ncbi:MAG: glycosyltransferase, partial [Myxococcota bacterium]
MRILTIVHGFHPLRGGAETAALEIAARTAAAGVKQTVLTAGMGRAPREEHVRGVRVLRTPMPPRRPGAAGP